MSLTPTPTSTSPKASKLASFNKELDFAKELAIEAGGIMRRYFRAEDIDTTFKDDNTPVTVADTTINNLVIEKVKEQFPGYGVIGEEESFESKGDFVWVLDPIDGTMPFSLGIPVSTFSLALVHRSNGQPVVAVAYDPQLDHLYSATKGQGAVLNDAKILTSKSSTIEKQYVVVGGGSLQDGVPYFSAGKCTTLAREVAGARVFNFYSFVYSAMKVASGDLVAAIMRYGAPWDAAGAALIAQEAGAVVTDFEGKNRRYDEWGAGCVVAANQAIHDEMMGLIKLSTK